MNFAVYSETADGVEVCLYDPAEPLVERARLALSDVTSHVWHGYVPDLARGMLYNLRARGPYAPARGLRFNHQKLLIDPYARALHGQVDWSAPLVGAAQGNDEQADPRDDAAGVPRCVVAHDEFDWSGEQRPETIWRKTVLYELHVRGFTRLHPAVPPSQQGTFAALAHPAVLDHLTSLGVTAVELMPVQAFCSEGFLVQRGLTNYWGYNPLALFAPEPKLAASREPGGAVTEFKQMVKALHGAGLEVLLDVVFNHTCEGNQLGPTLSFRGLDNPTYYWLVRDDARHYEDFTGCGNSLQLRHPQVVKLLADCLRYWVSEMHVDGFRFDLATTLGRTGEGEFDARAAFFQVLAQDPVLSRVKLIAEPWDLGPNGYRLGQFPPVFAEWNGRFRDTIRRYWRGDERQAAEIGYRLTGSSDLFKASGRRPMASVNFVSCHDGFTLRDLVTYGQKHNEANLEENRDGTHDNHSWNCGVEGETDDAAVRALREQQQRNFMATLLLSLGTPMLLAGDELSRTQGGNNNAYCQDNEVSWVSWEPSPARQRMLDFTRGMLAVRRENPVLQRRNFFLGATIEDSRFRDMVWLRPDGGEMTAEDWAAPYARALQYLLGGDTIPARDNQGNRITGNTLLVLMNAHHEPLEFSLPKHEWGPGWETIVDTATGSCTPHPAPVREGRLTVPARAIYVLRSRVRPVPT